MQRKTEFKWALIFVLMTLLWLFLERILGYHDQKIDQHAVFTNLILFPAIAVYVLALLDKKKKDYSGTMTYQQGLIAGLIITGIITLFVPITQSIISYIISPDYFDNAKAYAIQEGLSSTEEAAAYFNLKNYIVQGMIGTPVLGTATTLIVALFTRTRG